MPVILSDLPYALDALEPHVSRRTLELHHGAHHRGYVDKTNDAIAGTELEDEPLNRIVVAADAAANDALFNSAAQTWNHGFFWRSLNPQPTRPWEPLAKAIAQDFGSQAALREQLRDRAEKHFGSGWIWLVANAKGLAVVEGHDAHTPITGAGNPLLAIDVWEHAYYLDVQNERGRYVDAVVDHLLDWHFASDNFERGTPWEYPGR